MSLFTDLNMSDDLTILYSHGEYFEPDYLLKNLERVNGLFSYVVKDNKNNKIYLFQDRCGDYLWLYYAIKDDSLIWGNDFRDMVIKVDKVSMNMEAVKEYMISEFTWGSKTLVNEVNKVPLHTLLEFDITKSKFTVYPINFTQIDKFYDDRNLNGYKNNLPKYNQKIDAIALSAGFDSNLLLNTYYHSNIKGITIGAQEGRNDLPLAKEICTAYDIESINTTLTPDIFQAFPFVVLEAGDCYAKGSFFTYLLASLCKKRNIKYLMIGEGGNEVFNKDYNTAISSLSFNYKYENESVYKSSVEYIPMNNIINRATKKTGAIFNHFGITPLFPFLDLNYSMNLYHDVSGDENYRSYINKNVKPIIKKDLISQGGSGLLTNFIPEEQAKDNKYLDYLKANSKYYKLNDENNYIDMHDESRSTKTWLNFTLLLLYFELFEKIYVNKEEIKTLDEMLGIN